MATIGFYIKWGEGNDLGIYMHILILLPILISAYVLKINILKYKFNILSLFTTIMLIIYYFIQNKIYEP